MKGNKLSKRVLLGYGMGQFGEGIAYNFYYFFYTYFLVTILSVPPATAGFVTAFAVLWDAITDPLIGYLSDNLKGGKGKRRPFIKAGAIPLGIALCLLFIETPLKGNSQIVFLIITNMLFWLFFTMCDIPWMILGNEITDGFDEKTKIRTVSTILLYVGTIVSTSLSLPAIQRISRGKDASFQSWGIWAIVMGGVTAAGFLISASSTKGLEKTDPPKINKTNQGFSDFFTSVVQCFKVKHYLPLLLITLTFTITAGIMSSGGIFVMQSVYQLSEEKISLINGISAALPIVIAPVVGWITSKTDKRSVVLVGFSVIGVGLFLMWLMPATPLYFYIVMLLITVGGSIFWTLIFSMLGDVAEIDGIHNNQEREGLLSSLLCLMIKAGTAIGMGFFGVMLEKIGYQANILQQTESTNSKMRATFLLGIGAMYLASGIIALFYKLTRKKYNTLKQREPSL